MSKVPLIIKNAELRVFVAIGHVEVPKLLPCWSQANVYIIWHAEILSANYFASYAILVIFAV